MLILLFALFFCCKLHFTLNSNLDVLKINNTVSHTNYLKERKVNLYYLIRLALFSLWRIESTVLLLLLLLVINKFKEPVISDPLIWPCLDLLTGFYDNSMKSRLANTFFTSSAPNLASLCWLVVIGVPLDSLLCRCNVIYILDTEMILFDDFSYAFCDHVVQLWFQVLV